MKETKAFLKEMISIPGLSGYETPISDRIQQEWEPLTDQILKTPLNSLHAIKKGVDNQKGYSILIATHMDAIGFMVTSTQNGFLKLASIGGIDPRVLLGQKVNIHTETEILAGFIALPPAHTLKPKNSRQTFTLNDLIVETGLIPKKVIEQVKIGDLVSFANPPIEMAGNYFSGHSIDNRASVAILTKVLKLLQDQHHQWDVIAAATSQEEIGFLGAKTSAYLEKPTIAIILDVEFGKGPGTQGYDSHELNMGPVISWGPTNHPQLFREVEKLAEKLEIPTQKGLVAGMAGTDGDAIQIAMGGIPSLLIGVPIRYMHTPVELVYMKDIDRLARLLSAFITDLDEDFLSKLRWEIELGDTNHD